MNMFYLMDETMDYYCRLIDIPITNLHYISTRSAPILKIIQGQTTARVSSCARSEKFGQRFFCPGRENCHSLPLTLRYFQMFPERRFRQRLALPPFITPPVPVRSLGNIIRHAMNLFPPLKLHGSPTTEF